MKNRRQTLTTRLMSLSKLYLLPPTALYTEQYWLPWLPFKISKIQAKQNSNKLWGKECKTHLEFSSFSDSKIPITKRNISESNSGNKKVWKSF